MYNSLNKILGTNINKDTISSKKSELVAILFKDITTINNDIDKYINNINKDKDNDKEKGKHKGKLKVMMPDDNINFNTSDSNILLQSLCILILQLCVIFSIKHLDSKKEYKQIDYHIIYKILVAKTMELQNLFALFVSIYKLEPYLSDKKYYIGIDYEFHKGKDIRLMQINFEREPSFLSTNDKYSTSFIWVINPARLNAIQHTVLISSLIEHPKIYKIMQGADALDTPYMINELFSNNKTTIERFFGTFVDLRYLCEFYKANFADDNKCDIYLAFLYFDVITKEKYKLLAEDNKRIMEFVRSQVWEKSSSDEDELWNIDTIDAATLYYAVFDVVYLKFHLLNILTKSKDKDKFILSMKLIAQLTRYSLFEKHNISKLTEELKQYVDPINNFYFFKDKQQMKLIDAYKYFSENMILVDINLDITKLMKVNYFRNYIMYLLKTIIYYSIVNLTPVFVKTNVKYHNKYDIEQLYTSMEEIGFPKLNKFLKSIYNHVNKNFVRIKLLEIN